MSRDLHPPEPGQGPPLGPDSLGPRDLPVQFGRYRLVSILGEGGMGRVFLGEIQGPSGFRKPAAIKVIRRDMASAELRRSLTKEARLGGLLHHPNVVETYDYGEMNGDPFIVMEHVDGCGLDEVLAATGPFPPAALLDLAIQVCAGLHHAHELHDDGQPAGLIHRDLKPSNIMLGRNGVAKVMDFGVAKAAMAGAATAGTGAGLAKGTPAYMSPEQAAARAMDRRSDLFSLGAILYELAVGRRLFQRDSLAAVVMAVVRVDQELEDPAALALVAQRVPGLERVLRKCLQGDRRDRFADAAEIGRALESLRPGVPAGPDLAALVARVGSAAAPPPRRPSSAPVGQVDLLIPRSARPAMPPTETLAPARAPLARAPLPTTPKRFGPGTLVSSYPMLSVIPPLIAILILAIIGWTAWGLRADATRSDPPPGWRLFMELKGVPVTVDRVPPWSRDIDVMRDPDMVTVRVYRDDIARVSEGMGWVDDASLERHYGAILDLAAYLILEYGSTSSVPSERFKKLRRNQIFGRQLRNVFEYTEQNIEPVGGGL